MSTPSEIQAVLDATQRRYDALSGTTTNPAHVRVVKRPGFASHTGLPPMLDRQPSVNRTLCGAPATAADVLPREARSAKSAVCSRCLELLS